MSLFFVLIELVKKWKKPAKDTERRSVQLLVITLLFLLTLKTNALAPLREKTEPSIPFFRSPSSTFSSGIADLTTLNKSKKQIKSEIWYLIESQFESKWVPSSNLVFMNFSNSPSPNHQYGLIKETTTTLRFNKGWRNSKPISEGSKITINSIRSDWSCGFDEEKKSICVASDKVILPIDAAFKIKTISGRWYEVKARKKHLFITIENTFIPISKVLEWIPNNQIAFLRSPIYENSFDLLKNHLIPYLKIVIKEKEMRKWHQSFLEKHGEVWWQEPNAKKKSDNPILLTTEELESRNVFAKATTHLKNLTLASANGIFISKDNSTWKYLSQFGEDNYPVAIGPRNTLIVGDQISFDEGKNFQNYLKWDQIALQAQTSLKHSPQYLKLQRINFVSPSALELQIETGYKVLIFKFNTINNMISLQNTRLTR